MKKVQTLTLALTLVALGSVSWAATSLKSSRSMQKGPETTASNLNLSKSNINRSRVTQVNVREKTFAVQVTFSAAKLSSLPTVREIIEITYAETPGGGPMEATTVSPAKSNSSERVAADNASTKRLKGMVTEVNDQAKTFIVQVTFSAAKLTKLPTVGQVVDITHIEPPGGGGPLEASNLNLSKSNIN